MEKDQREKGLKIALRYIKTRPRSVGEVRKKLKEKKIPDEVAEAVIIDLIKEKILDDRRFAAEWVRWRKKIRPAADSIFRYELAQFGIPKEISEEILLMEPKEELSLAIEAAKRKWRSYQSLPKEIGQRRLMAFLSRRGFRYEIIKKTMEQLKS